MNEGVVIWKSFKQEMVEAYTSKANYIAPLEAAKEAI
jgi:hypothetical protein